MRTIVMVICYGLALGLGGLGVLLAAYGFYQHHSIFVTDQGIATIGIAINSALYIATGAAALGAAALLALAGREAQRA